MTTVSVVVATYRRPERLARLVRALEQQTRVPDEVVVVDDASGDETLEVLGRLADGSRLALRVVESDRNGGPAVARNRGWAVATGQLVAFTDDDCVPTPGWLAALEAASAGGARVAVGATAPDPDQSDRLGPFSRTLRVDDARLFVTCNIAYPRALLAGLGGFDESMRAGEDTELGLRATESGAEVVFAPEAVVHHDVRPSSLRATLAETPRWADLARVLKLHPYTRRTLMHQRLWWKPSHPYALAAAAGLLLALAGRRPAALLALPYAGYRVWRQPLSTSRAEAVAAVPGALLVDVVEIATMAKGSAQHRALVL